MDVKPNTQSQERTNEKSREEREIANKTKYPESK